MFATPVRRCLRPLSAGVSNPLHQRRLIWPELRRERLALGEELPKALPTWETVGYTALTLLIALGAGWMALIAGARHFERVEV